MTIFTAFDGIPKPVIVPLATTGATKIYSPSQQGLKGLVTDIYVSNGSVSGSSVTLSITDGTTTIILRSAVAVGANGSVPFLDLNIPVPFGWTIRATAADANRLAVYATVVEATNKQR